MSKFQTDQKLELVRAIRIQNQYDRQTLRRREGILYQGQQGGRHGEIYSLEEAALAAPMDKYAGRMEALDDVQTANDGSLFKGIRLRLAIAMILFLAFVYWDVKEASIAGKTADSVMEMLKEDQLSFLLQ